MAFLCSIRIRDSIVGWPTTASLLRNDGETINESAIINEYLDEAFPKVPLMPAMPDKRAKVRAWIGFANTQLHQSYMNILRAPPESFVAAIARFEADLTTLDQALRHSTKLDPYFNGAQFTLADITYATIFDRFAVFPKLRNYELPGEFRRVRLWMKTLASRPSVIATRPSLEDNLENCRRYLPESLRNEQLKPTTYTRG